MKFFENRANGQSKGFCVISLGSEQSMRMCLERLPKKELHGQLPVVTLPTKQALNQFESQCKTRSTPSTNTGSRGSHQGGQHSGQHSHQHQSGPSGPHNQHGPPRMVMTPPQGMRGPMPPPGLTPPRMQGPPPMHSGPLPPNQGPPPRFQQPQWNGPPRVNGPQRPGGPPQGPPQGPHHRPPAMVCL